MDNGPLIFTYQTNPERRWAPVIPFTLLRLPNFPTIHGTVYQHRICVLFL